MSIEKEKFGEIIEKSQEEGAKISETEKELSPEVIEKIMNKVQDINKEGTAIHSLSSASHSIFASKSF